MKRLEQRYLERMSDLYPTIAAAATEIINLEAILNLPKGTEHFLTDIHGEYEAFAHVLKNGSGSVRRKIDDVFGNTLTAKAVGFEHLAQGTLDGGVFRLSRGASKIFPQGPEYVPEQYAEQYHQGYGYHKYDPDEKGCLVTKSHGCHGCFPPYAGGRHMPR